MPTEPMSPSEMREVIAEGLRLYERYDTLYGKRGCSADTEDECPGCEAYSEWLDWQSDADAGALLHYALRGVEAEEWAAMPDCGYCNNAGFRTLTRSEAIETFGSPEYEGEHVPCQWCAMAMSERSERR